MNQTATKNFEASLDVEEMMMLKACVSKIRKHVERNLENAEDKFIVSRMLNAKWYLRENF